MIRMFTLIFSLFFLVGCLDMLTYREDYTIGRMAYWENKFTKEKASIEVLNGCYKLAEQSSFNNDVRTKYAECLYSKNYVFKTSDWLYCYHEKESCNIYDKYRK